MHFRMWNARAARGFCVAEQPLIPNPAFRAGESHSKAYFWPPHHAGKVSDGVPSTAAAEDCS